MYGVIIFFVLLGIFLWALQKVALIYYNKLYPEVIEVKPSNITINNSDEENFEEILPVIIAAATVICNSKVDVKHISFLNHSVATEWNQSGRIQNLTSHFVSVPKTYKY